MSECEGVRTDRRAGRVTRCRGCPPQGAGAGSGGQTWHPVPIGAGGGTRHWPRSGWSPGGFSIPFWHLPSAIHPSPPPGPPTLWFLATPNGFCPCKGAAAGGDGCQGAALRWGGGALPRAGPLLRRSWMQAGLPRVGLGRRGGYHEGAKRAFCRGMEPAVPVAP